MKDIDLIILIMQKIQNKKLTIQYDVYVASKGWFFIFIWLTDIKKRAKFTNYLILYVA